MKFRINVGPPVASVDNAHRQVMLPTAPGHVDFDFKTLPSIPCTREAFLEAMYASGRFCVFDRRFSTDNMATAKEIYNTVRMAEWFDFGRVDADDLAKCGTDAIPFLKGGLLRAPYERCVFRLRMTSSDPGSVEVELLLMVDETLKLPGVYHTTVFSFRANGPRNDYISLMTGVVIDGIEPRSVGSGVVKDGGLLTFYEYAGLWSILNTRGVSKLVVEPDAKLNRSRARSGKPPLQRVVRVDTAQYVTALRETHLMEREGTSRTHRSPRMHLRRGHMRTFSDPRYKGLRGKMKWIRPMIVGGDVDRIVDRKKYEVKR